MPGAKKKSDTQVRKEKEKQQGPIVKRKPFLNDNEVHRRRSDGLVGGSVNSGAHTGMNKSDAAKRLLKITDKSTETDDDLYALDGPKRARKTLEKAKKDSAAAMKRLRGGKK